MGREVKDTELVRKGLTYPYVNIYVTDYGSIMADLEVERKKPRGGVENIIMSFELEEFNLECIGRQSVQGLRKLRKINDARSVRRLESVTGWKEGDGPRGV